MKTRKQRTLSPWAFAAFAAIFVFGFAFAACGDKGGGSDVAVTGITLNKTTLTLAAGLSETLIATVTPPNATSKTVTWTTSNQNYATVANGVVTAQTGGVGRTVTITAKAGDKTATCAVNVTAFIAVTGITLSETALDMWEGDTIGLTATIAPANASNKAVTWSSSDEDTATVDYDPVTGVATVTAVSVGTATITATSVENSSLKATCAVTVTLVDPNAIRVTGVTLNKNALTLTTLSSKETLIATVEPSNATRKTVSWSSSAPTIASVSSTGEVTAVAAGEALITVTTLDGNKKADCAVTVEGGDPNAIASVTLNYTERTLNVGQTVQLIATVLPEGAANRTVTWSTSNANIATVSNGGLVTAQVPGQVSITVTSNADSTKFASCTVTVPGTNVASVSLNASELELFIDEIKLLSATVLPTEATVKTVTWTSSDEDVAFVLNAPVTIGSTTYPAGSVAGFEEGVATITATTKDGGHTAQCTVTVKPVPVTGVTVYPPSLTLSVGGSPGLITPTVEPANATNTDVTWTVTSSTPSTGVVSVDEFETPLFGVPGSIGRVTPGNITGSATVRGTTEDGGFYAEINVTVTEGKKKVNGMVWIEPGVFMMGARDDEMAYPWERPRHQVRLTAGFYMTEIAVSQALYREIMGENNNPSFFDLYDREVFTNPAIEQYGPYWPVDSVTWYDAVEFCNKLSTKRGLQPVYTITNRVPSTADTYPITSATVALATGNPNGYRLPTEAEWEYACRAGTTSPYNTGYDFIDVWEDANYDDGSDDAWWQTNPGGLDWDPDPNWPWLAYPPNNWGLYDMHGNLDEWCWDWFSTTYYTAAAVENPMGPASGPEYQGGDGVMRSYKITRGGSWYDDDPDDLRSASRNQSPPGTLLTNAYYPNGRGYPWLGFRIVLPEAGGNALPPSAPLPKQVSPSIQGNMKRMPYSAMKFKSLKSFNAKQLLSSGTVPLSIKGHGVKAKQGTPYFSPAMLFNLPGKIEATSPVKPQALRRKSVLE
jgi:uncharacterized protein YjdB